MPVDVPATTFATAAARALASAISRSTSVTMALFMGKKHSHRIMVTRSMDTKGHADDQVVQPARPPREQEEARRPQAEHDRDAAADLFQHHVATANQLVQHQLRRRQGEGDDGHHARHGVQLGVGAVLPHQRRLGRVGLLQLRLEGVRPGPAR